MNRTGPIRGILLPILLALVPGWGHIWLWRNARGVFLFAAFTALVDYAFLTDVGAFDPWRRLPTNVAWAGAAGLFAFSVADVLRIVFWSRSKKGLERRRTLFRRMVVHYLRDEFGQAEDAVQRMLRLTPTDAAILFWEGMIYRDSGRTLLARRAFKRALQADRRGFWSGDIEREMGRLFREDAP